MNNRSLPFATYTRASAYALKVILDYYTQHVINPYLTTLVLSDNQIVKSLANQNISVKDKADMRKEFGFILTKTPRENSVRINIENMTLFTAKAAAYARENQSTTQANNPVTHIVNNTPPVQPGQSTRLSTYPLFALPLPVTAAKGNSSLTLGALPYTINTTGDKPLLQNYVNSKRRRIG